MEAVYFYYSTASCGIDHTNSLHHCRRARLQLCVCDSALIKGLVFWLAGGVRRGRSRLSLSLRLSPSLSPENLHAAKSNITV